MTEELTDAQVAEWVAEAERAAAGAPAVERILDARILALAADREAWRTNARVFRENAERRRREAEVAVARTFEADAQVAAARALAEEWVRNGRENPNGAWETAGFRLRAVLDASGAAQANRESLAKAWDKGYTAGVLDCGVTAFTGEAVRRANPYRDNEAEEGLASCGHPYAEPPDEPIADGDYHYFNGLIHCACGRWVRPDTTEEK